MFKRDRLEGTWGSETPSVVSFLLEGQQRFWYNTCRSLTLQRLLTSTPRGDMANGPEWQCRPWHWDYILGV